MFRPVCFLAGLLISGVLFAQDPGPQIPKGPPPKDLPRTDFPNPDKVNRPAPPPAIPTPADAARMAWEDVRSLPVEIQGFQRYFLTTDRSPEFYGAFSYTINTCLSHNPGYYIPAVVQNGWLIRLDLRTLWPKKDDFDVLFPLFEGLREIDPYFHVQGEVEVKELKTVLKDVPPYQGMSTNGKIETLTQKRVQEEVVRKVKGAELALHLLGTAEPSPEAAQERLDELLARTASQTPILRADWFMAIVLSTNPDDNGKYYDFRRISKSKDGKTAEQLWVEGLGVDYDLVKKIRSDQRVAKFRSKVTGKPRAIEYTFAPSARASIGPSILTITRDYFDGTVKANRHPVKTLDTDEFDGSEGIGFLPNGMLSYILTDAKGERVDVAPQRLVTDTTVPGAFTKNLVAPISCLRCHAKSNMWLPAKNDVMTMTNGRFRFNFFDDVTKDDADAADRQARLFAKFSGEIEDALRDARRTHAKATDRITGNQDLETIVLKVGSIYNAYRYDPITPERACLEFGWDVSKLSEADQAAYLDLILPRLAPNRVNVQPESATLGGIKESSEDSDLFINRDDFEQEYADAMLRVHAEAIRQRALDKKPKPEEKK